METAEGITILWSDFHLTSKQMVAFEERGVCMVRGAANLLVSPGWNGFVVKWIIA